MKITHNNHLNATKKNMKEFCELSYSILFYMNFELNSYFSK